VVVWHTPTPVCVGKQNEQDLTATWTRRDGCLDGKEKQRGNERKRMCMYERKGALPCRACAMFRPFPLGRLLEEVVGVTVCLYDDVGSTRFLGSSGPPPRHCFVSKARGCPAGQGTRLLCMLHVNGNGFLSVCPALRLPACFFFRSRFLPRAPQHPGFTCVSCHA
jgi:hypothetical protein